MLGPRTKFLGSPYLQDPDLTIYNGDVREVLRELPDESVQMCVTSPPYWGLRDYGTEGQIGLEPTPEAFVATMVEVFREVRRALRKDGTLWLNLGDSYISGQGGRQSSVGELPSTSRFDRPEPKARPELPNPPAGWAERAVTRRTYPAAESGYKPKDLAMMPARVALALQADGWYLRSEITWCKPNPMPESVTDRPTQATENVYLFSKSARYFYDAEAVREPAEWARWGDQTNGKHEGSGSRAGWIGDKSKADLQRGRAGRNLRNWWEIATEPYPEAHFATYPQELVRRCILAGTSERGCCPECGAPWVRETEQQFEPTQNRNNGKRYDEGISHGWKTSGISRSTTTGWRPSCGCYDPNNLHGETNPQGALEAVGIESSSILDPFFGSGTTGLVARKHGRKCIGIELSPEYCALAAKRLSQLSLLAEGAA